MLCSIERNYLPIVLSFSVCSVFASPQLHVKTNIVKHFNADQLLTERCQVSALVRDALMRRSREFNIVLDDVAITYLAYGPEFSQEAEGSRFLVARAEQERHTAIVRAEGESQSARLISEAAATMGTGLIELRRIEAAKEIAGELARSPNVSHIPAGDRGQMPPEASPSVPILLLHGRSSASVAARAVALLIHVLLVEVFAARGTEAESLDLGVFTGSGICWPPAAASSRPPGGASVLQQDELLFLVLLPPGFATTRWDALLCNRRDCSVLSPCCRYSYSMRWFCLKQMHKLVALVKQNGVNSQADLFNHNTRTHKHREKGQTKSASTSSMLPEIDKRVGIGFGNQAVPLFLSEMAPAHLRGAP